MHLKERVVRQSYFYAVSKEFRDLLISPNRREFEIEWQWDELGHTRFILVKYNHILWRKKITDRHWEDLASSNELEQLRATCRPIQHFVEQAVQRIDAVMRGGYD